MAKNEASGIKVFHRSLPTRAKMIRHMREHLLFYRERIENKEVETMNKEEAKLSRVTPPAPVPPTAVKRETIEISEDRWMLDGNVEISRSFDVTMTRHPRS